MWRTSVELGEMRKLISSLRENNCIRGGHGVTLNVDRLHQQVHRIRKTAVMTQDVEEKGRLIVQSGGPVIQYRNRKNFYLAT